MNGRKSHTARGPAARSARCGCKGVRIYVQVGGLPATRHLKLGYDGPMNSRPSYTRRAVLAAALGLLTGCAPVSATSTARGDEARTTLFCFDTVCTMGGVVPPSALEEARTLCEHFEQTFSRTIATSDVGRINASAGEWCEVAPETSELVEAALSYCALSEGRFDITVGALTRLWDFHEGVVPDPAELEAALPHVDWRQVEVSPGRVRLADSKAALDLGGIAKGFIADKLLALFAERGATSAYVNLGGNVAVLGPKADGSPWRLGVRDPGSSDEERVVASIQSTGGSLVTSGLYERCFELDGTRYWHILDPRTGYPVQTNTVSASVYAQRSLDGDGLTKALFFMDHADALAFAEAQGVQALLVDADGSITSTAESGFLY